MGKELFLRKLFIGLLLVCFDINIQLVDILPDFLGWIFILWGLNDLSNVITFSRLIDITALFLMISHLILKVAHSLTGLEIAYVNLFLTFVYFFFLIKIFKLLFIISAECNKTKNTKIHFGFMLVNFILAIVYINGSLFLITSNNELIILIAFSAIQIIWYITLLAHIQTLKKGIILKYKLYYNKELSKITN